MEIKQWQIQEISCKEYPVESSQTIITEGGWSECQYPTPKQNLGLISTFMEENSNQKIQHLIFQFPSLVDFNPQEKIQKSQSMQEFKKDSLFKIRDSVQIEKNQKDFHFLSEKEENEQEVQKKTQGTKSKQNKYKNLIEKLKKNWKKEEAIQKDVFRVLSYEEDQIFKFQDYSNKIGKENKQLKMSYILIMIKLKDFNREQQRALKEIFVECDLGELIGEKKNLNLKDKKILKNFCQTGMNMTGFSKENLETFQKDLYLCTKVAFKYDNKFLIKEIVNQFSNLETEILIEQYLKYNNSPNLLLLREILKNPQINIDKKFEYDLFKDKNVMLKNVIDYSQLIGQQKFSDFYVIQLKTDFMQQFL